MSATIRGWPDALPWDYETECRLVGSAMLIWEEY